MKKILISVIITAMAVSCGTSNKLAQNEQVTRGQQYAKMYEEKPVTLLVMPPINNSSNVEAKDLLYTSISKPLAEAGYYVISPLLAMDILKAESAYDAEMFVNSSLSTFHNFFGCSGLLGDKDMGKTGLHHQHRNQILHQIRIHWCHHLRQKL